MSGSGALGLALALAPPHLACGRGLRRGVFVWPGIVLVLVFVLTLVQIAYTSPLSWPLEGNE